MSDQTIRDVVFRLKIELAESQMQAPEVRPVLDAQEKIKKSALDAGKAAEDAARRSDDTIRQAWERRSREVEKLLDKERALREKAAQSAEQAAERLAATQEKAAYRASKAQTKAAELATKATLKALDSAVSLARGVALLGIAGEKDTEKLVRGFVRISAAVDILRGMAGLYNAVAKAIRAATAAQMALNAAQAAGGAGGVAGKVAGAGGKLLSGGAGFAGMGATGTVGLIALGTAAGLGAISIFSEDTRGGLAELLGFSDIAGDERERGARMQDRARAYNEEQNILRQGRRQAAMVGIQRDTVGMQPLEAADFTAGKLRAMLGQSGDPRQELEITKQIAAVEERRLSLIQERVQSQREAVASAQKELELKNSAMASGALGFLGMNRGDQRITVRALQKLKENEQLSVVEMQHAAGMYQFMGAAERKKLEQQALDRASALGLDANTGGAQQDIQAIQDRLQSTRAALDATIQKYGKDFQEAQEKIVKAILDQVKAALEAAAEFAASEKRRHALIKNAQDNIGDSPAMAAWHAYGDQFSFVVAPFVAPGPRPNK